MKKIGKSFLFAVFGLLSNPGFAQLTVTTPTTDNANEKSSTSIQGSGKYGNFYGVNLYTGTASVTIPLYEYHVDNLNLGVSLSYDTKGQKVDQIASSTGLGFSLSAGGSIQRDVFGIDDEMRMRGLTGTGQYGQYNLLSGQLGYWGWQTTQGPQHEEEYDLFNADIGGRSFQFTISGFSKDPGGHTITHCKTFPKSDLKIDVYEVNPHWPAYGPYPGVPLSSIGAFSGIEDTMSSYYYIYFVITDEKGNRFFFDRGDYELKLYDQEGAINPYSYYSVNNWVIKNIVTYTNDTIKYSYREGNYLAYPVAKDEKVKEVLDHEESYGIVWDTIYTAHAAKIADSVLYWKGYHSHLSKIEYPDGSTVTFNFEDDPNKIRCDLPGAEIVKSVRIENKYDNNTINSFLYRFNYAYFKTPDQNPATEIAYGLNCGAASKLGFRLKLKGIDKIGTDGITTENYFSFNYNPTPLPIRLSPSRDYYGYYNGHSPLSTSTGVSNPANLSGLSIPLHTFQLNNNSSYTYGVDRTPDINYLQACNLTSVKNSLGGELYFFYKDHNLYNPTNSYSNSTYGNIGPLPDNFQGDNANDGLCIDSIVFKDGFNVDNTTVTKYEFAGGQRFFRGGYFWNPAFFNVYPGQNGDSFSYQRNIYTNNYVTPRQFVNGANHGYTFATVKNYGYNHEYLGCVKHKFTNLMDENDTTVSNLMVRTEIILGGGQSGARMLINQFHPKYFYQYKMGLELQKTSYDINGDMKSKTTNTYVDNSPLFVNAGYNSRVIQYNSGLDNLVYYSDEYSHFYPKLRLLKTSTTTTYSGSAGLSMSATYNYDNRDKITDETWTDSKGDTYTKKHFYNYSLINGNPVFDSITYSSDREYEVVTELWKKINGNDFLIGYTKNNPPGLSGVDHNDFYSLKSDIPVPQSQYNNAAYMAANVTEDKHYTFDDKGNAIEARYKAGTINAAAIWDTRIGKKIAEVNNAKYNQIAYTSFEGAFSPWGTFEYSKGNWDFDPAGIIYSVTNGLVRPMTGDYHYQLTATGHSITSFNPLQSGMTYRLSFWATSAPVVMAGNQPITISIAADKQYWKLYTATIQGNNGIVSIASPSGTIHLDELRLHPFQSRMETATYEPMLGTGSKTDAFNKVTYYQYDKMGRANVIRDRDGNIRSLTKETIQGTDY